jgi:SAM-dependent methyltransferase
VSDGEAFVRAFHDARPGVTAAAFARGGSYARLAAAVPAGARRVLDLACGDGELSPRLAAPGRAIVGVDVSAGELRAAHARGAGVVVQARAQQLPFADAAFDAVACHLALMLFADLDAVAAELARVVAPGGALRAVVGGGPVAGDDDGVYERWLAATRALRAELSPPALGDPRASRERGWRDVMRGFGDVAFTRFEVDLGGTRADAFAALATSYACAHLPENELHRAFAAATAGLDAGEPVAIRAVLWLARATRI